MPRNPLAIAQTGSSELPEITTGQKWTGFAVLAAMAVGILYIWYRTRFVGLPPSNADHKDTLWSQLYHRDPATLRLPATADVTNYRPDLRELAAGASDAVDKREATVSGALADAKVTAAQTYAPVLEKLPTSAIRTVQLAVLVAVLGAPAVSTAAVLELLHSDGGDLSISTAISVVVDATMTVATLGVDTLTAFPYAGTLFSLALTVVMIGGEWLFVNWQVTAAVLVGGAVTIIVLDYYRERTYEGAIYENRRNLAVVAAKRVGAVWLAGVAPVVFLSGAGLERAGAILGVLAAAIVGLYYLQLSAREAGRRLWEIAQWGQPLDHSGKGDETLPAGRDVAASGRARPDRALAGYLFVRRLIVASWLLTVPLVAAYVVTGISSGAYMTVLRAFLGASPLVQSFVLAAALSPAAAILYLGRGSVDDFVTGLRETISRRRVRLAAMRRGVPVMAVVATCAIVYSMFQVVWLAIVASVAVGIVARVVYELLMAAKYRVSMFDWANDVDRTVLVEAYVLEDADGTERYYARLNGSTDVLVDSRDELADAVIDAYPAAARRDKSVATVPMWRADFALRYGIVDPEETETKLKERVRKRALRELREEQWAYRSDLEETTAEYPREKLESWLRWGRRHGVLSVEADATGDDVVLLKRDPWQKESA